MEAEEEIQNGDSNVNEVERGDVTMKLPLIDVNVVEQIDMVLVLKISKCLFSCERDTCCLC